MNKYPITITPETMDAYFMVTPGSVIDGSQILTYTHSSAMLAGSTYETEIKALLVKLYYERYYTSILGINITTAAQSLNSIIKDSATKYGQIIKSLTASLIDDIIKNYDKIRIETETDYLETITDAEAEDQDSRSAITANETDPITDSTLRKRNDTPQAGNNPDLLSDTYLSQSERNIAELGARMSTTDMEDVVTRVIGERERTHHKEGIADKNYTLTTRIANLDSVAKIWTHLQDAYANWLDHIDKKALVI